MIDEGTEHAEMNTSAYIRDMPYLFVKSSVALNLS